MSNSRFFDYIEQAVDLGYDSFGLTPITGEIFTDKRIFDKLNFLENHPKVRDFHFFTNFTALSDTDVINLLLLRKLSILSISLYGHDKTSFFCLAEGSPRLYDKLVSNLNTLYENYDTSPVKVEIGWRTEEHFDFSQEQKSDLALIVRKLRDDKNIPVYVTKIYDNWGGLIAQSDIQDLDIHLTDEKYVYKSGSCALIFYKLLVMADGRVNACECRDANATLCIGDLNKSFLRQILSTKNQTYMQLIENQQKGIFNPICHTCNMYRSIYKLYDVYRYHKKEPMSLEQFYKEIQYNEVKHSLISKEKDQADSVESPHTVSQTV